MISQDGYEIKRRIIKSGHEAFYREGSTDYVIMREHLGKTNCYDRFLPIQSDDIVMDVGGHAGFYAVYAAPLCKMMHVYEPLPANIEILKLNVRQFSNVWVYPVAICPHNSVITFYPGNNNNYYLGSTQAIRRRKTSMVVRGKSLDEQIIETGATYLKVDIEGGEASLLVNSKIPHPIQRIIFEWHYTVRQEFDLNRVMSSLIGRGFSLVYTEPQKPNKWTGIFAVARE